MKKLFILFVIIFMLTGCATLERNKAEFKQNPVKYTVLFVFGTAVTVGCAMLQFPVEIPMK